MNEVETICGQRRACDHPTDEEGPRLSAASGACEAAVCNIDPHCCNGQWDRFCVEDAMNPNLANVCP